MVNVVVDEAGDVLHVELRVACSVGHAVLSQFPKSRCLACTLFVCVRGDEELSSFATPTRQCTDIV
eukprot:IDg4005t1